MSARHSMGNKRQGSQAKIQTYTDEQVPNTARASHAGTGGMKYQEKDKRVMQIKYLEGENGNLSQQNEDLATCLKLNKDIIKTLLDPNKGFDEQMNATFTQLENENDLLQSRVDQITSERDALNANFLMQQQIMLNIKDKEDDIAEIYKDEIDELKENLERKEYLLQVSEQRIGAYEKLLYNLADGDERIKKQINDQNIALKDRKISNVVIENEQYREQIQTIKQQNQEL